MSEDFCLGGVFGFALAGVVGFIFQQIYLAYKKMGEAGRPQKVIAETEKTPTEVIQGSITAGCGLLMLVLVGLALAWLLAETL